MKNVHVLYIVYRYIIEYVKKFSIRFRQILDHFTAHFLESLVLFYPFDSYFQNKKALYALVCESLRYYDLMSEVLERTSLLKHEKALKKNTHLGVVLLYEHLLGKGLTGKCQVLAFEPSYNKQQSGFPIRTLTYQTVQPLKKK